MARKDRKAAQTLLLIGEGHCEVAFLNYLRSLYAPRGCGLAVTVYNAHGKGPENVLQTVLDRSRNKAYDQRAALLDTDLAWPAAMLKQAKRERIVLVGSQPCLEGLLLNILGYPVPDNSSDCKKRFHALLTSNPTESVSYSSLFTVELLDRQAATIETLAQLLRLFQKI